jgi:hypothetical protein
MPKPKLVKQSHLYKIIFEICRRELFHFQLASGELEGWTAGSFYLLLDLKEEELVGYSQNSLKKQIENAVYF